MLTIGVLSGLLNLLGTIIYIIEIVKQRSVPERATWLIWTCLGIAAFFSQKSLGASSSLWFVGLQTVGVTIVFVLSIWYGTGGFSRLDVVALLLAFLGALVWIRTVNALFALIAVITARSFGVFATVVKTYRQPNSEAALPWFIYTTSAILAIIAVGEVNFSLLLYPSYVLVADIAVLSSKFHKRLLVSRVH